MKILALATVVSLTLHGAILLVSREMSAASRATKSKPVRFKVVKPPPPPPPPPPKVEPKPEPKPKPKPKSRRPLRKNKAQPVEAPKPSPEPPPPKPAPPPMGFSVDMSSTVMGGGVAARAVEGGGNMFADPTDNTLAPGKKTSERPPPATGDGKGTGRGDLEDRPPTFITSDRDRVPPYPDEARKNDIEGRVLLRVYVGVSGRVEKVKLIKGIGYGCDEIAMKFAKKYWRFKPAIEGGSAVGMWIPVPVTFVLER